MNDGITYLPFVLFLFSEQKKGMHLHFLMGLVGGKM